MVFVLVGHFLRFLLQLQKLCIFFFDVAFRLGHVLLELGVQINEHVLPVKNVFLTIREHLVVSFDLTRETFGHLREFPLMCSVRCDELIIENAFHFHLLCILLVIQVFLLFRRVVKVIVIR